MMDVEMGGDGSTNHEKTLKLHPLAIIGISDHYTRVSTGGSALPLTAATIGLLFGQKEVLINECVITIIDAEEVETSVDPSTLTDLQMAHVRTKIELHQKVFPQHQVVGWYKVTRSQYGATGDGDGGVLPTPQDISIHNGWMREFNPQPLFLLMDSSEKKAYQNKDGNTDGEDAREQLDRDEELPIALYEIMNGNASGDGAAFVHLDFGLETFGPERMAVEKVFRTRPKVLKSSTSSVPGTNGTGATTGVGSAATAVSSSEADSKTAGIEMAATKPSDHASNTNYISNNKPQTSEAEVHIQSLIKSVGAMNARVAILLDFLHKSKDGSIEPNHELLRQVMSLVKQLPLVMGRNVSRTKSEDPTQQINVQIGKEYEKQHGDALVMSYLASLAKTTKSVVAYSEKFRLIEESVGYDAGRRPPYGRHGSGAHVGPREDTNLQKNMGMYMD